jgi:hypothetical protein
MTTSQIDSLECENFQNVTIVAHRRDFQRTSTRFRRGDIMATTLPLISRRSPPSVATKSDISGMLTPPSSFIIFVDAKANTCSLEILPPASIDSWNGITSMHLLRTIDGKYTHAKSNRVFRAHHISWMPMPTVTLCCSNSATADSSVKGGPGRLKVDETNTNGLMNTLTSFYLPTWQGMAEVD